jgi:DNA-binding transcriptional regulator PaaX
MKHPIEVRWFFPKKEVTVTGAFVREPRWDRDDKGRKVIVAYDEKMVKQEKATVKNQWQTVFIDGDEHKNKTALAIREAVLATRPGEGWRTIDGDSATAAIERLKD